MFNIEEGTAILDYERTKSILERKGVSYFLKLFDRIFKRDLYSFSNYWIKDSNYELKFKGVYGDVIITWKSFN